MEHVTVGRKYNEGKIAHVSCNKNLPLDIIDIKDKSFMLLILESGTMRFSVDKKEFTATSPAFICFGETENPVILSKSRARYVCICFNPVFLNVNMTFELLRSAKYEDIATTHDMFMLKPFIDKAYVVPIAEHLLDKVISAAEYLERELSEQRDWYWSCRSRSYFMEIIITLERMYGVLGYGGANRSSDLTPIIRNNKLRDAVLYIEGHYGEGLTLAEICKNAKMNHTTLTRLMKDEFGCTVMEYLMRYRLNAAKKQLAFTAIPIKDISLMVGFKTVQHFNRSFKKNTATSPAEFRKRALEKRKAELQ